MILFPAILKARKKSFVPMTWTQATTIPYDDHENYKSVTSNGVDTFVVSGLSGKIVTATDPTGTWSLIVPPNNPWDGLLAHGLSSVRYANSIYVAVGTDNYGILTASNPNSTWSIKSGFTVSDGERFPALFYANGFWVFIGDRGCVTTATDPRGTWTQRSHYLGGFPGNPNEGLYYGNGMWVAVGVGHYPYTGGIYTATDPTGTWTERISSFNGTVILGVAYGNGVWVAVGEDGKLATATDPTGTWTQRTSSFGATHIHSVAYANGAWVIGGEDGKLATAIDPTGTWTQRTSSFSAISVVYGLGYEQGYWIAVGNRGQIAWAISGV